MGNGNSHLSDPWRVLTLTKRDVDRRTFLKMLGALGITVGAGGLLEACVSAPPAQAPAQATQKPPAAAPKAAAPRKGGTLVAAWEADPLPLDPMTDTRAQTTRLMVLFFERLMSQDFASTAPTPPIIPQLATSWQFSPDGLALTMELRKGVKFHDGTPFNAEAVKFNMDRSTQANFQYYTKTGAAVNSVTYSSVAGTDVVGEYTARIRFKEFDSGFIEAVATRLNSSMVSPEAIKKWGNEAMAQHPVGTGPFKVVEQEKNVKVVLEKNAEYWGGEPHLDRIIIRIIPEDVARVISLQNGEIDFAAVPSDSVAKLSADPNFKVVMNSVPSLISMHLNHKAKPWSDRRVRQAANYAVNREVLTQQILKGTAIGVSNLLVPGSIGYDANYKYYTYDPNKARALLKEAGYADGFETTFQAPTTVSGVGNPKPMLEYIQQNLAEVGIKVKYQMFEQATFVGMFPKGMAPEVGGMLWPMSTASPSHLERFYSDAFAPPKGRNLGAFSNSEVESLIKKGRASMNEAERIKLFQQADRIAVEDGAVLYLISPSFPKGYHKKVKGFVPANAWEYSLASIYLED